MRLPGLKTNFSKINNLLELSTIPKIILTAIEVGVFEAISTNKKTVEEIVCVTETGKKLTIALLKVLIEIELVEKDDNRYFLKEISKEYLLEASKTNQIHGIKAFTEKDVFDNLKEALKKYRPTFDHTIWSSKERITSMEQGAKGGSIQNVTTFITNLPEFNSANKMCDFAGNIGYYSFPLLAENKNLKSHLYDLSDVCKIGKELKKDEADFDRIIYHDFDIAEDKSFGDNYDLFFSSHFLYQFASNGYLTEFLKKVNQTMKIGSVFVSNHICNEAPLKATEIILSIVELKTKMRGYPTHQISEKKLLKSLTEAGFDNFTIKRPDGSSAYPVLLIAARKVRDV